MDYVKSILRFVIVFFFVGITMASEPSCLSRFDYDEKMLLKILKFEDALGKFDNMITDMREELKRKEQYSVPLVMFKARHAFGTHTYTSVNTTVIFEDVMTNEGGSFEPKTGKFTASVPGVYMFIVQYCPDTSKWAWLEIVSESRGLIKSGHKGEDNGVCVSMQTFAKVTIGEKIWVRCTSSPCQILGNEGFRWNTFEGILLRL